MTSGKMLWVEEDEGRGRGKVLVSAWPGFRCGGGAGDGVR